MSDLVLKLGSSVLASEADLDLAVHEVYRHLRDGHRVVAVVSALAGATDALLARARAWGDPRDPHAVAALLGTGEAQSAALLALALGRAGTDAALLDPASLDLRAAGDPLDAELISADRATLDRALDRHRVAIVPGFVARDAAGRPVLLGRGGSDHTALFLAWTLGARCRLLKDVDGIYDRDPAVHGNALRYAQLGWDDAIAVGGRIVQPKAVAWARDRGVAFEVARVGDDGGTLVNGGSAALAAPRPRRPLRVALLGLGTVGEGVRALLDRHDDLELIGIAVRDRDRPGVPPEALTTDAAALIDRPCDVVIELIGGLEPARTLVATALAAGRHVITANKALLAAHGPELHRIAAASGARLRYSAAVGGAVPVIEQVRALQQIDAIEGVLNGTCNYVLDRIDAGASFDDAVADARRAGFAEADPSLDLDGHDAAHKLTVLAREAWGADLPPFTPIGLRDLAPADLATTPEGRVRLVARCARDATGIRAEVAPIRVATDHPLGEARGADNCVVVHHGGGRTVLRGQGAGRWPTATSVLADLLELQREVR